MSPVVMAHRVEGAQPHASTITLTFLRHTDPPANKLEKKLIPQYEQAHPNIRINYITVPDPTVFTKFESMSVAGSPPDIINFGSTDVPEVWQRGQLAPVDLCRSTSPPRSSSCWTPWCARLGGSCSAAMVAMPT